MDEVLRIVTLGRAARNEAALKNRQPLACAYVQAEEHPLDSLYQDIIAEELNIREVCFVDDASRFTSYRFKPQLKILGQKYGKRIGAIRTALEALDGSAAKQQLDAQGAFDPLPAGRRHPPDRGRAAHRNHADGKLRHRLRPGASPWPWTSASPTNCAKRGLSVKW